MFSQGPPREKLLALFQFLGKKLGLPEKHLTGQTILYEGDIERV